MEQDLDKIYQTIETDHETESKREKGRITVTGANYVFFAFTAIFILFQFLLIIPFIIFGKNFIDEYMFGLLLVNQYIIILVPVIFYTWKKKLDIKDVFRLRSPGIVPVLVIILMALPAFFTASMLNSLVIYVLQFLGDIPMQQIPVPKTLVELFVGILVVAVSPAICEELLHRGIMLRAYEKRGTIKAIIITSIYFGIFHFDVTNLVGPIFLGLLIAYYVVRTNSIFAGILAHFLNNAISQVFQFLLRNQPRPQSIRITQIDLIGAVLYGVVAIIILTLLFRLFTRITKSRYNYKLAISSPANDIAAVMTHWPIICIFILYFLMAALFILPLILSRLV